MHVPADMQYGTSLPTPCCMQTLKGLYRLSFVVVQAAAEDKGNKDLQKASKKAVNALLDLKKELAEAEEK
jgi:hypothetical protein